MVMPFPSNCHGTRFSQSVEPVWQASFDGERGRATIRSMTRNIAYVLEAGLLKCEKGIGGTGPFETEDDDRCSPFGEGNRPAARKGHYMI